ncbi:MAG: 4Fe-4S dicluster domain-containing protein, partial [Deltaproteobacteria bacterium]|nr:4Fe-4S dicluster domain-containing protein [Deltaproteobacteria bacterium]
MAAMQDELREIARQFLGRPDAACFIGHELAPAAGNAPATRPVVLRDPEDAERIVCGEHCHALLAAYLPRHRATGGLVGIAARGCEARALRELVRARQVDRASLFVVGLGCAGLLGPDGAVLPRCQGCRYPEGFAYDLTLGEMRGPDLPAPAATALAPAERRSFWEAELAKCIRCEACRKICYACYCPQCFFESTRPRWISKRGDLGEKLAPRSSEPRPARLPGGAFLLRGRRAHERRSAARELRSCRPRSGQGGGIPMSGPRYLGGARLRSALDLLAQEREVIVPLGGGAAVPPRLGPLPVGGQIALPARKPLLPLKMLFLPECEDLFRFEGSDIAPPHALARERVVVGALACDIAALDLLDRVLASEPADEAYCARRSRTSIVALACTGEGPECFCAALGLDPLRPSGADALLVPVGGGYLLEALTVKGEPAMRLLASLLRRPRPAELQAAARLRSSSRRAPALAEPPGGFAGAWSSALFAQLAERCLACGICTVTCPTCHCFDVQDERRGRGGARLRAWDSCMFADFTRMASGENPRAALSARLRQRFLHKLCYFAERHGAVACVGCGRC